MRRVARDALFNKPFSGGPCWSRTSDQLVKSYLPLNPALPRQFPNSLEGPAAAHARGRLQQQIARDLPDTKGATITEVDVHELEADEAEIVGEHLAIVLLSTHHMYGACFVPRPPGALLH